jgi:hypothetical protein
MDRGRVPGPELTVEAPEMRLVDRLGQEELTPGQP